MGQPNHVGQGILSQEEKNRILHRHSGYCKNTKLKRPVQPTNVDDLILEVGKLDILTHQCHFFTFCSKWLRIRRFQIDRPEILRTASGDGIQLTARLEQRP